MHTAPLLGYVEVLQSLLTAARIDPSLRALYADTVDSLEDALTLRGQHVLVPVLTDVLARTCFALVDRTHRPDDLLHDLVRGRGVVSSGRTVVAAAIPLAVRRDAFDHLIDVIIEQGADLSHALDFAGIIVERADAVEFGALVHVLDSDPSAAGPIRSLLRESRVRDPELWRELEVTLTGVLSLDDRA